MTEELKPTELLPCPFCGGKAIYEEIFLDRHYIFSKHVIDCEQCGVTTDDFGAKAEVVAAWNRRKEDA